VRPARFIMPHNLPVFHGFIKIKVPPIGLLSIPYKFPNVLKIG
jgi:hypothetical protein